MTTSNTTQKSLRNTVATTLFALSAMAISPIISTTAVVGTTVALSAVTVSQAHALPRSEFRRNRRANRKLRKAQRKKEASANLAAKKRKAEKARAIFKTCTQKRIKAINAGKNPGAKCKLKNSF